MEEKRKDIEKQKIEKHKLKLEKWHINPPPPHRSHSFNAYMNYADRHNPEMNVKVLSMKLNLANSKPIFRKSKLGQFDQVVKNSDIGMPQYMFRKYHNARHLHVCSFEQVDLDNEKKLNSNGSEKPFLEGSQKLRSMKSNSSNFEENLPLEKAPKRDSLIRNLKKSREMIDGKLHQYQNIINQQVQKVNIEPWKIDKLRKQSTQHKKGRSQLLNFLKKESSRLQLI